MAKKTKKSDARLRVGLRVSQEFRQQLKDLAKVFEVGENDMMVMMLRHAYGEYKLRAKLLREQGPTGRYWELYDICRKKFPGLRPRDYKDLATALLMDVRNDFKPTEEAKG